MKTTEHIRTRPEARDLGSARFSHLVWPAVVLCGCLLRVWQYLKNQSYWADEGFLVFNVQYFALPELLYTNLNAVSREFDHGGSHQVAPPLFLLIQKWMYDLGGTAEWAMRLQPMVASCLVLVVLWAIFWRLQLSKLAGLVALSVVAFAPKLILQAANAKQYSSDVLVSCMLLGVVTVVRKPARAVGLCFAMTGVLVWYSYTGAVVGLAAGGMRLLLEVRRAENRSAAFFAGCGVSLAFALVSILACLKLVVANQRVAFINQYWAEGFFGLGEVFRLFAELFEVMTAPSSGMAVLLLVCFALHVVVRVGQKSHAVLTSREVVYLGPLILAVVCALMSMVPLVSGRVTFYLVPVYVLILASLIDRLVTPTQVAKSLNWNEPTQEKLKQENYRKIGKVGLLISTGAILLLCLKDMTGREMSQGNIRDVASEVVSKINDGTLQAAPLASLINFTGDQVTLRVYGISAAELKRAYEQLPPGDKLWALTSYEPTEEGRARVMRRFEPAIEGSMDLKQLKIPGGEARLIQKPTQ